MTKTFFQNLDPTRPDPCVDPTLGHLCMQEVTEEKI